MAKKVLKKNEGKEKVVIIFIEGDTEEEFYKRLLQEIRIKAGGTLPCKVEIKNVKGVGQYKVKVSRIFERRIKKQYPNAEIDIFLSYDTDVFELGKKPPVNWDEVVETLYGLGANAVHRIEAKKSIEDWILYDIEGIRDFLKLPKKQKLDGYHGTSGLQQLFKKANKTYVKGNNSMGLVQSLDFKVIFPKICSEIRELCLTLGLNCSPKSKLCG